MSCFRCPKAAIGECRICAEPYCPSHGNVWCERCQQALGIDGGNLDQAFMAELRRSQPREMALSRSSELRRSVPKRVVEVLRTSKHGNREITLVSAEIHDGGVICDFHTRSTYLSSTNVNAGFSHLLLFRGHSADDLGNNLEFAVIRGNERNGLWNLTCQLTPEPSVDALAFHVSIDEVQLRRPFSQVIIEHGLWEFSVPL